MARTVVIGAGVAGLSTAIHLRRFGHPVLLIDRLLPPGGASFGNAGFISPDSCVPTCSPGMLRRVPRWLTDPEGPLRVQPSYAVSVMPWLLRWIASGRRSRTVHLSSALHVLHRSAWRVYRDMLGERSFEQLMRPHAVVAARNSRPADTAARPEIELERRLGIERETLGTSDIRRMFPGISPDVSYGEMLPQNGYVVSTTRLFRTLADVFREEGGRIEHEDVLKIVPDDGGRWRIITNTSNHKTDRVVICAGAWSTRLLAPLGARIPLESQRGYHVMLPSPSVTLEHALIHQEWAIGVTPMEEGLRVAGTIEFAGLDRPPDERRAQILLSRAKRLFPELQSGEPSWWMGHRPCLPDDLPVLGAMSGRPGLFACFGHGTHGLSGGPMSGRAVAEVIANRPVSIDLAPFSDRRFAQ